MGFGAQFLNSAQTLSLWVPMGCVVSLLETPLFFSTSVQSTQETGPYTLGSLLMENY